MEGCVITSPSFLIVALRYIGDVLVSTPLAISIKEQFPESTVDYLVFAGTESILSKNPYVRRVHTVKPGEKGVKTFAALWRRYNYAIGCNPSDRTVMFAAGAGYRSFGFSYNSPKEWWKALLLDECRHCDDRLHIVPLILKQLEGLGISPIRRVVMGFDESDRTAAQTLAGKAPYIILHPYSRRHYKEWPPANWAELASLLSDKGLRPLFTRSPATRDQEVASAIAECGVAATGFLPEPLPLTILAAVISAADAYVGVDTVVTHMAAALDVPVIALYGPTLARHWGPWPNNWPDDTPYAEERGIQRRSIVTLMQQDWPCVPCNREECSISERNMIECLNQLTASEVFDELLNKVGI